ncbi:MAG: hypothetical protein ABJE63_08955 [Lentilitoribacter sp.]
MSSLQKAVIQRFIEKLSEHGEFDQLKINKLREIVEAGKKPKPDDLIEIFGLPHGGDTL